MFTKSRFLSSLGWVIALTLFEIATVLVRLNHVTSFIINANHRMIWMAAMLSVVNRIAHCVRLAIPQATEWHRKREFLDCSLMNGSVEQPDLKAEQVQRMAV